MADPNTRKVNEDWNFARMAMGHTPFPLTEDGEIDHSRMQEFRDTEDARIKANAASDAAAWQASGPGTGAELGVGLCLLALIILGIWEVLS